MQWFFIALVWPILYACANHTDKYFISRYLKNGEVGALIIFSSIFGIIALPVVLFIHPTVFNVSFFQGVILAINSMLVVIAVLLYFYALQKDEASYPGIWAIRQNPLLRTGARSLSGNSRRRMLSGVFSLDWTQYDMIDEGTDGFAFWIPPLLLWRNLTEPHRPYQIQKIFPPN